MLNNNINDILESFKQLKFLDEIVTKLSKGWIALWKEKRFEGRRRQRVQAGRGKEQRAGS